VNANSAASPPHYPFDNAAPQAGERFARLSELYDGVTGRHLDLLGIGPGWRCLEVGAGGGSIARFMSERVGSDGHVLATDINTDWLPASLAANVDVRNHDIGVDPLAKGAFDLVHARAVLTFVPGREGALTRMIAALKPGGWLLVEELVPPVTEPAATDDNSDSELAKKSRRAIEEVIRRRGGDPAFGRKVPGLILAAGLIDIGAEGYFVPFCTDAVAGLARANIDQIGAEMIATGLMSSAELDRYRATLDRPDCLYPESMALISVWGRRPLS
jgi:SAM-dependent methyltransferase